MQVIVGRGKAGNRKRLIGDLDSTDKDEIRKDAECGESTSQIAQKRNVAVPVVKKITQFTTPKGKDVPVVSNVTRLENEEGVVEIISPVQSDEEKINAIRSLLLTKLMIMSERLGVDAIQNPDRYALNIASCLQRLSSIDTDSDNNLDGMSKMLKQITGRPFLTFKK